MRRPAGRMVTPEKGTSWRKLSTYQCHSSVMKGRRTKLVPINSSEPTMIGRAPVEVHQAPEQGRGEGAHRGEGERGADLGAGPAEGLLQRLDEVTEGVLGRADRDRHRQERGGGGEPAAERIPRFGSGQSRRAKGSMPSLFRRISSRVRPWRLVGEDQPALRLVDVVVGLALGAVVARLVVDGGDPGVEGSVAARLGAADGRSPRRC